MSSPEGWETLREKLIPLIRGNQFEGISKLSAQLDAERSVWQIRALKAGKNSKASERFRSIHAKTEMFQNAVRTYTQSALSKKTDGPVRLSFLGRLAFTALDVSKGLAEKSGFQSRLSIDLALDTKQNLFIELISAKGIFWFASKHFIKNLSTLMRGRQCLEIGAGDGSLSQLLNRSSIKIHATDNASWKPLHENLNPNVEKISAQEALRKYQPKFVLCAWPPPSNSFEAEIFKSKSVDTYVVIGSRFEFASGNWDAYRAQSCFSWTRDEQLAQQIFPPESQPMVHVFRKIAR